MTNTERNQVVNELLPKVLEAEQEMLSDQTQTAQLNLTADEMQVLISLLTTAEDDPSILNPAEMVITHEVLSAEITCVQSVVSTEITHTHDELL